MSAMPVISLLSPETGMRRVGIEAPSGQPLELFEVLVDQVGDEAWLRFRFHAPRIGRNANDLPFDKVEADFEALCNDVALPYMRDYDLLADRIVVALYSQKLEFGQSDPDVTQFIEVFRSDETSCIWEGL